MSDQRDNGIAWTDETWNPLRGCSKVSAGCKHCYAETMAARFAGPGQPYEGTIANGRWNGNIRLVAEKLAEPLRWRRPRRIFVNSMSDLFHDEVPLEYIQKVFAVMEQAHWHQFQVLTKRAERLEALSPFLPWPSNVWMGVSVENDDYTFRIDHLRRTGAVVKFLSVEPLLGPIPNLDLTDIDWVIVGGESGTNARPFDVAWALATVRQCKTAGVPVFVKQLGARPVVEEGSNLAGLWAAMPGGRVDDCGGIHLRDRAGADPSEWPEDMRVREWPEVAK